MKVTHHAMILSKRSLPGKQNSAWQQSHGMGFISQLLLLWCGGGFGTGSPVGQRGQELTEAQDSPDLPATSGGPGVPGQCAITLV